MPMGVMPTGGMSIVTHFFKAVCLCLAASAGLAATAALTQSPPSPPAFKPIGGVYTQAVQLILSTTEPEGEIYYTLDGREPGTNSLLYRAPITLNSSVCVRARVICPNRPPGEIAGQPYTLLAGELADFSSNLPLLILNTYGVELVDDQKRPAYLTVIGTNNGRARLAGPVEFQGRAGVELRGSSSSQFPKRSLGLSLVEESGAHEHKASLLGMPADSDWVLYAPYSDKSFMRDVLAYDLWEEMGHYSVRRRFVELFWDADGRRLSRKDYAGIYVLLEKIKQGKHRVNIAKLGPDDIAEPEVSGGYILKRDRMDANDNPFHTTMGIELGIEYPKAKNLVPAQRKWVANWFRQFESVLRSDRFRDTETGYASYIDVPTFIDYYWIVEMPKTIDGYTLSVFMHKDRLGKLKLSPIWDRNLSFGNANYQDGESPSGWYSGSPGGGLPWLRRLMEDPDFDQARIDRWGILRRNLFAPSNLLARVDAYAALLDEAQARDFARWPRLGIFVWPNAAADWPNTTFEGTLQFLKNFIKRRIRWLDRQFLPAPVFNQNGGTFTNGFALEISAQTNKVFYTLDGQDPRQQGGGLNPAAMEYNAPIPLASSATVFARARRGNTWGPPTTATFIPEKPAVPKSKSKRNSR